MPVTAVAYAANAATTWGSVLMADAAILASGISAYSTLQQGQFAAGMADYNAKVMAQEAESTEEAGEYETRDMRREKRMLIAKQLTSFAKGGVVPSAGTPLNLGAKTAGLAEMDIRMTQYGYGLSASQALSRGRIEKAYGKSQKRASRWQAGTTLLTGASQAGRMVYRI